MYYPYANHVQTWESFQALKEELEQTIMEGN